MSSSDGNVYVSSPQPSVVRQAVVRAAGVPNQLSPTSTPERGVVRDVKAHRPALDILNPHRQFLGTYSIVYGARVPDYGPAITQVGGAAQEPTASISGGAGGPAESSGGNAATSPPHNPQGENSPQADGVQNQNSAQLAAGGGGGGGDEDEKDQCCSCGEDYVVYEDDFFCPALNDITLGTLEVCNHFV